MECQKIEIFCPKCEEDGIEHKASVLGREEAEGKEVIRFQCDDCKSVGTLKTYKMSGIEVIDCHL